MIINLVLIMLLNLTYKLVFLLSEKANATNLEKALDDDNDQIDDQIDSAKKGKSRDDHTKDALCTHVLICI